MLGDRVQAGPSGEGHHLSRVASATRRSGESKGFLSATDELLEALTSALAEPGSRIVSLGAREYVAAHEAFELSSSQQSQIRHLIELEAARLLRSGRQRSLRVLSVGCGSGQLDLPLLRHLAPNIGSFVGIDPNPAAIRGFRERRLRHDDLPPCRLVCTTLENLDEGGGFDLIYCAHVLYYPNDRMRFLQAMLSLLRRSGSLFTAHAPHEEMNRLAQVFWSRQRKAGFYEQELRQMLDSLGPWTSSSRRLMAGIPTDLLSSRTPQSRLLLEFLIQAQWEPLAPKARRLVRDYITISARRGVDDRDVLPHPAIAFVVRSSAVAGEASASQGTAS